MTDGIPFQVVTDKDLLRAMLFNRCALSESGCWEWTRAKDARGYGMFSYQGKDKRAHRVSFQAFKGPISTGLVICHSCDNPSCINPNHLRAGTMKENMADREARGRRDVRGEQIGTAKLTEKDVLEIRASDLSLVALADKYGIDKSNVWLVRAGKSWKHLNTAEAA